MTPDNVAGVLNASKKYIVTNLTKKCKQFLEDNLYADTAIQILEQSMFFAEEALKDKALETITQHAPTVLSSEDFLTLSEDVLREILQLNLMIGKEMEVFEAAVKWAKNKCECLNKSITGVNLREALGTNLFLIRFPAMTMRSFCDEVVPSGILTSSEEHQVLQYHKARDKPHHCPFPTRPHYGSDVIILVVPGPHVDLNGHVSQKKFQIKNTNLTCQISRPILLRQILVHGCKNRLLTYHLRVTVSQRHRTIVSYANTVSPVDAPSGAQHSVHTGNTHLKAGQFNLDIALTIKNTVPESGKFNYCCKASPRTASELCDNYVTISFPPVADNFLFGIKYIPAD